MLYSHKISILNIKNGKVTQLVCLFITFLVRIAEQIETCADGRPCPGSFELIFNCNAGNKDKNFIEMMVM